MRLIALVFLSMLTGLSPALRAEVIEMPSESASSAPIAKPSKGVSMASVLREYGAPSQKHRPVGGGSAHQPPITRWDYPGFSVFFENDHVVDAVVPGQPPAVRNVDELKSTVP